ncbi:MAG: acetoin utilization protein AcuC [Deltaproteobacteria bacterium]|nr:acetoin utilization protein AcuC [Deltaproteobacteria bacterium]
MARTAFLCSEAMWGRGHGEGHPLKPERLRRTWELLRSCRAFDAPGSRLVEPAPATREELTLFHSEEYVEAVALLSRGEGDVDPGRYGFGPGDNPVFEGMFETEALKAGGALTGVRLLLSGEADTAFSFAGGFHHARPQRASGFCVFNDAAAAIAWLTARGRRVAYVDVDVHHGDGVQAAFYETDRVLTVSLHQDPHTLFPGTGFPEETGAGAGQGFSANVPLPPCTTDDVYLWAFRQVVPPLVRRFAPDVLVTQLGVDTHFADPLARLLLTTRGYVQVVEELKVLAALTAGWLSLGGGGYSLNVVPRAWTLAYGVMGDLSLPEEFPVEYAAAYGPGSLHDLRGPDVEPAIVELTWECARASVDGLRRSLGAAWPG